MWAKLSSREKLSGHEQSYVQEKDYHMVTNHLKLPVYSVEESRKIVNRLAQNEFDVFEDMKSAGPARTLPCIIEVSHTGEHAHYRHLCIMTAATKLENGTIRPLHVA